MTDLRDSAARTLAPRCVAHRLGRRGFLMGAAGVAGALLVGRGAGEDSGWTASGAAWPSATPGPAITGTLNLYRWR